MLEFFFSSDVENPIPTVTMSGSLRDQSCTGVGDKLVLSEELSDFTILVKSEEDIQWRFPVHKLVLSAQSSVLRRMIDADFSEKNSGEMLLSDIQPHIVKLLLEYMYRGKSKPENWQDAIQLLRAAHKYQIEPLVEYCGQFLENILTIGNSCDILEVALLYSIPLLKEQCMKLILKAGFVVLRSKAFEMLSSEAVMDIVSNNHLVIDSELIVYEALLRWAPMHCCRTGKVVTEDNVLEVLTPFLKHVCFNVMIDSEKSSLSPMVLAAAQTCNQSRMFHSVSESLMPYCQQFHFKLSEEPAVTPNEQVLCLLHFSVNSPQFLIGFKLLVEAEELEHPLRLQLEKEMNQNSSPLVLDGTNIPNGNWRQGGETHGLHSYVTTVPLRQPVLLDEKTAYKVILFATMQTRCPAMELCNRTVLQDNGQMELSLHCDTVYGIKSLMFV